MGQHESTLVNATVRMVNVNRQRNATDGDVAGPSAPRAEMAGRTAVAGSDPGSSGRDGAVGRQALACDMLVDSMT